MSQFPADILSLATTTVSKISSLMEDAPTLGAAATEIIAEALMGARPVVKPLEWRDGDAKTGFGSAYTTHQQGDGLFVAIGCGSFVGGTHPTRDAAKASAQSDYEARILSAISSAPAESRMQPVWAQNLISFIDGKFPADETWKAIFVKQLAAIRSGEHP